jgi:putative RecB family exonuclease
LTDVLNAPEYLSPSSIATFHQCPFKYKLSRIDGLKEPPTEHTLLGNYVHSILEEFYRLEASERTVLGARTLFRAIWDDYAEAVIGIYRGDKVHVDQFRLRARYCVENLLKMEPSDAIEFDGIETELNHAVLGVQIKGFIDRWAIKDGKLNIGDYKTGKVPQLRFRDDKFDQLLIYAIILSELEDKEIGTLELLYIKDGVRLTKEPTEEDVNRIKSMLVETRNSIDERCQTGVFETKVGVLCGWCHFKPICPAWSKNK